MISALLFGIVGFTVGASIVAIAFADVEPGRLDAAREPERKH